MKNRVAIMAAVVAVASVAMAIRARAAEPEIVVGAAPSEPCPVCEVLDKRLEKDVQEHLWKIAYKRFPQDPEKQKEYYAAIVGLADGESGFDKMAYNAMNLNGTIDRGMFQINSKNISDCVRNGFIRDGADLYLPVNCADCADYLYWQHYRKYGFSRRSYDGYLYNDGKEHDNVWTRRVWNLQETWYDLIFRKE